MIKIKSISIFTPQNFILASLGLIASGLILHGSYIHVKAELAQYLLQKSWHIQQANAQQSMAGASAKVKLQRANYIRHSTEHVDAQGINILANYRQVKPWPWFDSYAVAKLHFPSLNQQQIVLAGDSGQALAFGPGMSFFSTKFGGNGTIVIAGHRDTHFSLLQYLNPSEIITLEDVKRQMYHYRINNIKVIDVAKEKVTQTDFSRLVLVTCYPFGSDNSNTTLRYIIEALPIGSGKKLDDFTVSERDNKLKKQSIVLLQNANDRHTQSTKVSF